MKELKRSLFYISLPISFIGFIFPIYASSLGVNAIQIGYLFSIFSLIGIIIRPMVGNLIDNRGRRTGILIGIFLYTLVNGVFFIAKDFRFLLIARIMQSFAASFLWISVDTTISDISDKNNRGKNFGIIDQSLAKGQILGSTIGFTLLYNQLFKDPFKPIFLIFFCTSIISLIYTIKEVPETISYKKDFEQGTMKNKKDLISFLIIIGSLSLIVNLTAPIYLLYLEKNITSDLSKIAYLFVPSAILSTFLPKKFGSISDLVGREKTIIIGVLLNAILQILIPFNQKYNNFLILYTLISIVIMYYSPALSSLIMDYVGEEKRGKSYGRYNFASGIGAAIGPILGSYVYEHVGDNTVFFLKGGLLIVMVVIICYIYIKKSDILKEEKITENR